MFLARIMISTSLHMHVDDDKIICVTINCQVWIKMTLRLKASDWRTFVVRGVSVGRGEAKKWREARQAKKKTMYNLWLFFTSFHRSFIIFLLQFFFSRCNMQLVFLFLIYSFDFRYYRWKKKWRKKLHCNWHSILIMRFFFLIVYLSVRLYVPAPNRRTSWRFQ